jgi:hypothetical protein
MLVLEGVDCLPALFSLNLPKCQFWQKSESMADAQPKVMQLFSVIQTVGHFEANGRPLLPARLFKDTNGRNAPSPWQILQSPCRLTI